MADYLFLFIRNVFMKSFSAIFAHFLLHSWHFQAFVFRVLNTKALNMEYFGPAIITRAIIKFDFSWLNLLANTRELHIFIIIHGSRRVGEIFNQKHASNIS